LTKISHKKGNIIRNLAKKHLSTRKITILMLRQKNRFSFNKRINLFKQMRLVSIRINPRNPPKKAAKHFPKKTLIKHTKKPKNKKKGGSKNKKNPIRCMKHRI